MVTESQEKPEKNIDEFVKPWYTIKADSFDICLRSSVGTLARRRALRRPTARRAALRPEMSSAAHAKQNSAAIGEKFIICLRSSVGIAAHS